jgi:beta-phosphoglucomutase-like phosphatase (HAD superfamily)
MIKTEKIILTDCDGVLLAWEGAFHQWMESKGFIIKEEAIYDISKTFGIPKSLGNKLVKEFNESAWMGFLPAFKDARSGVAKLVEHGWQFIVITSLSLDSKAQMLRVSNLKNIFGKNVFIEVICLDTGADKDEELVKFKDSGLWWIEDKPKNAEVGLKYGLKPIIIEHEHNKEHEEDGIEYAYDWEEILTIIEGE